MNAALMVVAGAMLALALARPAGAAATHPPDASGATIFDFVSDHTLTGTTKAGGTFHQFYRVDGVAFIEVPTPFGAVIRDRGTWWIDGNQLCRRWNRVVAGRNMCTAMRFDGAHVDIVGSSATLSGTLALGDTNQLSSIEQTGTAITPAKPLLVYISGMDCPFCIYWDKSELPKLKANPAFKAITFREVQAYHYSYIKDKDAWPADLMWLHDKIKANGGTPRWVLVRGHRIVAHAYGIGGWLSTMLPLVERVARHD